MLHVIEQAYHDFGPVVTNGLCLADGRPVEVEYPVERSYPRTGFDVAAQERVAIADERRAREARDDRCVSTTHEQRRNTHICAQQRYSLKLLETLHNIT